MRKLQTRDVFKLARVIKNLNLKEDLRKVTGSLAVKDGKVVNVEEVGFDLILSILDKAVEENSEKQIYEFLAGPFECTSDEVSELDLVDLIEKIKAVSDIEGWKNFLNIAIR